MLSTFRLCRYSCTFFYFNYIVIFGILICFDIKEFEFEFEFWCLNATFSNISAISWRPVLVVEEAGVPGENHRPWASNWYTLTLAAASRVHPFL